MRVLVMISVEKTGWVGRLGFCSAAVPRKSRKRLEARDIRFRFLEVAKIASQALPLRFALAALSSCHCATAMACTSLASSDACVPVWVTCHVHVHTQHHLLDLSPRPSTGTSVVCFEPVQKLRHSRRTRRTPSSIGHLWLIACDTFPLPP